jgi:hypothetical protein
MALVPFHKARLDRKLAAVRHGVPGVPRQVHEHPLQLIRIGANRCRFRLQLDAHLHVFAHQALQHRPHLLHHAVQIEHARLQDLLAAESQQLLGQSRGPLPGLVDLFQTVPERIARLQPAEQQPAVPVDHRQQVVEVVRHPARQPSDALQFLSLAQLVFYLGLLGFRAFQFGNVDGC